MYPKFFSFVSFSTIVISEHLFSAVLQKKTNPIVFHDFKQSTKSTNKKPDSFAYSTRPCNIHLEYIKAASKETKKHLTIVIFKKNFIQKEFDSFNL